jgi:hypothetical protein
MLSDNDRLIHAGIDAYQTAAHIPTGLSKGHELYRLGLGAVCNT